MSKMKKNFIDLTIAVIIIASAVFIIKPTKPLHFRHLSVIEVDGKAYLKLDRRVSKPQYGKFVVSLSRINPRQSACVYIKKSDVFEVINKSFKSRFLERFKNLPCYDSIKEGRYFLAVYYIVDGVEYGRSIIVNIKKKWLN